MISIKKGTAIFAVAVLITAASTALPVRAGTTNLDTGQSSSNNNVISAADAYAGMIGTAGNNASGNLGFNIASGFGNIQSNLVVLQTLGNTSLTHTEGSIEQESSQNDSSTSGNMTAQLGDTSSSLLGSGIRGNLGVNVATGDLNLQANQLLLVDSSFNGNSEQAVPQEVDRGSIAYSTGRLTSTITGGVSYNGAGNSGLNSAAGSQNLQANQLFLFNGSSDLSVESATQLANQEGTGGFHSGPYNVVDGARGNDRNSVSSTVNGDVFHNFNGNGGANSAAGQQNMQSNMTLITDADVNAVTQTVHQQNDGVSSNQHQDYASAITGNTAREAAGNIGVNSATGAQNIQTNLLALFSGNVEESLTQLFNQANDKGTANQGYATMASSIDGNAAYEATGNIGFNSASGASNLQGNATLIVMDNEGSPDISQTTTATDDLEFA